MTTHATPQPEIVHVHAASCNDYSGCTDQCRPVPREQAVWRNGAWRESADAKAGS